MKIILNSFILIVASICYRHYYFQRKEEYKQKEYKYKKFCASLVKKLFEAINECHPPIVELSDYTVVEGNPRRDQALQLTSEHSIPPETAYNIIDGNITLDEVVQQKNKKR